MRLLLPLLACLLSGCSVFAPYRPVELERADAVLAQAQGGMASGDFETALGLLIRLRNTERLPPEVRQVADVHLQTSFEALMESYADDTANLMALSALELPDRLRAAAAVRAAERMLETGERLQAFRTITRLDAELPFHPSRAQASEVVAGAGFSLIRDDGRYRLILRYRTQGKAALEYLVLNYPSSPHCPEAYIELAQRYEESRDLDDAIERCEDLLVYHPGSPYAVASEARLPYLRMLRLRRDSYDRRELVQARREIDRWLALHAGHELEPWVRELRIECFGRLARSDLHVARHYHRYRSAFGARIHAERALAEARVAELEDLQAEALALLEKYPPVAGETGAGPSGDTGTDAASGSAR